MPGYSAYYFLLQAAAVKVPGAIAAGEVAAGYLVKGLYFRLPGGGVQDRDRAGYACNSKYILNGFIVLLGRYEGEQRRAGGVFVALYNFGRCGAQRDAGCLGSSFLCLVGYVLNSPVYYAVFRQLDKVPDSAADIALKYKYIPLDCKCPAVAQVGPIKLLYFLGK